MDIKRDKIIPVYLDYSMSVVVARAVQRCETGASSCAE